VWKEKKQSKESEKKKIKQKGYQKKGVEEMSLLLFF
jgi:hypothetical protein